MAKHHKYKVPPHLTKLVYDQVAKYTFRSSTLRDLIDYQILYESDINSLNSCRHYVNKSGVCPYDELYKPIRSAIDRYKSNNSEMDSKHLIKIDNYLHNLYKNKINNKLYLYTVKRVYDKLKHDKK